MELSWPTSESPQKNASAESSKRFKLLRFALIGVLVILWVFFIMSVLKNTGLFRWLGIDYGFYYSQSVTLLSGDTKSVYSLPVLDKHLQELIGYTSQPGRPLDAGPVPYPPVFAWLFGLFTQTSPPIGFAFWTLVNTLGALHLARRVWQITPRENRVWAAALVLTSFPIVYTLFVGQPLTLLACAVAECYLSLRAGNNLQAGLWLSCLVMKPQYGILIAAVLLWKRQWFAVIGAALGIIGFIAVSAWVAGVDALLTYPSSLSDLSGFRGQGTVAYPEQMINWRALVINYLPSINDNSGILITLVLGAISVLCLVLLWRGPWKPSGDRFPGQLLALVIVTLLGNYHSHVHGMTLLIVPAAAVLANRSTSAFTRAIIMVGAILPSIVFTLSSSSRLTSIIISVLMIVCLASILIENSKSQSNADQRRGEELLVQS
jgi:hypothetical protein